MDKLLNFKYGHQLFLRELWRHLGGTSEVTKLLKLKTRQSIDNWSRRGKVSYAQIQHVADTFKIPKWGLDYRLFKLTNPDTPAWSKVVKSYGLPKEVVENILKLNEP